MNKKIIIILLFISILLFSSSSFAIDNNDYWHGAFDEFYSNNIDTSILNVFDNDVNTSVSVGQEIIFDKPVNFNGFKVLVPYITIYDRFYATIKNNGEDVITLDFYIPSSDGVTPTEFVFDNTYRGDSIYIYSYRRKPVIEMEFSYAKLEPLILTTSSTVNKISLSWNDVELASNYEIYLNGVLKETLDTTSNSYVIEGLSNNTEYNVTVKANSTNYESSVSEATVKTLNYFVGVPQNTNSDLTYNSAHIVWDSVPDTNYYEFRFNGGSIEQTTNTFYDLEGLDPLTSYTFEVRQVNLDGLISDWKIVNFTTLDIPELPPYQVPKLTLIDKGTDFIEVKASDTELADSYNFYLDTNYVGNSIDGLFRFEGLEDNKSYSVSVRAKNKYGVSRMPTGLIVLTDEILLPTVTDLTTKVLNNDYNSRYLEWESKYVNQGFKLLLNGEEIGTFTPLENSTTLNLSDYSTLITGDEDFINFELVPIDPDGIGYKTSAVLKGTGNNDLDLILSKILESNDIFRKAGRYLIFGLLSLGILFLGALFLFYQFKLHLTTDNDEELQAHPSQDIVYDINKKDGVDHRVYKIAERQERKYFKGEKENNIADRREVKSKGLTSDKSDAISDNFEENRKFTNSNSNRQSNRSSNSESNRNSNRSSNISSNRSPNYSTDYTGAYRVRGKQISVKIKGQVHSIDLDDYKTQLKYYKTSNYNKQVILNTIDKYNNSSKFEKFTAMATNDFVNKHNTRGVLDNYSINTNREKITNKYSKYRINNDGTMSFEVGNKKYKKFDIADFKNQFVNSNLDDYTKDLILNSVEHYQTSNKFLREVFKDKNGWTSSGKLKERNDIDVRSNHYSKKELQDNIIKQFGAREVSERQNRRIEDKQAIENYESNNFTKVTRRVGDVVEFENGLKIDMNTGEKTRG